MAENEADKPEGAEPVDGAHAQCLILLAGAHPQPETLAQLQRNDAIYRDVLYIMLGGRPEPTAEETDAETGAV